MCQIDTVLHYFLRTESRKESNRHENLGLFRWPGVAWHKQNRPEARVAWGKHRHEKAN